MREVGRRACRWKEWGESQDGRVAAWQKSSKGRVWIKWSPRRAAQWTGDQTTVRPNLRLIWRCCRCLLGFVKCAITCWPARKNVQFSSDADKRAKSCLQQARDAKKPTPVCICRGCAASSTKGKSEMTWFGCGRVIGGGLTFAANLARAELLPHNPLLGDARLTWCHVRLRYIHSTSLEHLP